MSTKKTQNYNLHSWEPGDDFLRSEFNDNFTALDQNLKALDTALKAETAAREQAVSGEAASWTAALAAEKTAREKADADEAAVRKKADDDEAAARKKADDDEATARANAITAEQNARKQAITAEQNARAAAISSLTSSKVEIVTGTYTGDGVYPRAINLGFQPKALLLITNDGRVANYGTVHGGLMFPNHPLYGHGSRTMTAEITSTGFIMYEHAYARLNGGNGSEYYYYIAFK